MQCNEIKLWKEQNCLEFILKLIYLELWLLYQRIDKRKASKEYQTAARVCNRINLNKKCNKVKNFLIYKFFVTYNDKKYTSDIGFIPWFLVVFFIFIVLAIYISISIFIYLHIYLSLYIDI